MIDDSFRYFNGKDSYKLFYTFIKNGLRNSAVIYTSRRRRFINLCDSFAILDQGKILKQGRKDELVDVFDELFLENIGSPGGREGSVGRKYGKLNDYGATASRNQSYKDPSMTPSSLKDDFNIYVKHIKNSILIGKSFNLNSYVLLRLTFFRGIPQHSR